MRYRGPAADAWVPVELDPFTAVYHRTSGQTHLLAEPAPQLLATLTDRALTLAGLREELALAFDLPDVADDGLAARLGELVEAGLVAVA